MSILVTGASGMIGNELLNSLLKNGYEAIGIDKVQKDNVIKCDLGNIEEIDDVVKNNNIKKIIHLAAIAHTKKGEKIDNSLYYHVNVECSDNVFKIADKYNIDVLYISTVDVYGFTKKVVTSESDCHPISIYAKTKYSAEQLLKKYKFNYSIYRFSPVYTENTKRDIEKRIYLKSPNLAYQIGKNTLYEVLNISKAINEMILWCDREPTNDIKIIKDEDMLSTKNYIKQEKMNGKAKFVLRLPRWIAVLGYKILRITGKNKYTYLLSKAIYPLRSK